MGVGGSYLDLVYAPYVLYGLNVLTDVSLVTDAGGDDIYETPEDVNQDMYETPMSPDGEMYVAW